MYLKYRLQWFPLETKNILHFLFLTRTPFVFVESWTREMEEEIQSNT